MPDAVAARAQEAVSRLPFGGWSPLPRTRSAERRVLASGSRDGLSWLLRRAGLPGIDSLVAGLDKDDWQDAGTRIERFGRRSDVEGILAAARTVALAADSLEERRLAYLLYEGVIAGHGPGPFRQGWMTHQMWWHTQILVRLTIELRLLDRARCLLDEFEVGEQFRTAMEADLLNPVLNPIASQEQWLAKLNEVAGWSPEEQLSIDPHGAHSKFDSLVAPGAAGSVDGPLVSVILPCFQPDAAMLRTSVQSLLAQTYANIEVIIVDDASGPRWVPVMEELASRDARVRVLHREENGGAYVARNLGMRQAVGEFIAFQDSDDWSSPRRLEFQVAPLLDSSSRLVATHSNCVRASDDLMLTYRSYPAVRINAWSMVMRRSDAMSAIGYFVPSRKGADSEYAQRLEFALPGRVQGLHGSKEAESLPVLAFLRLTPDSLSRNDFRVGYRSSDRSAFEDAYRWWHKTRTPQDSWWIPDQCEVSPFPLPSTFRIDRGAVDEFDTVLLVDALRIGHTARKWLATVRTRADRGERIGFVPMRITGPAGGGRMSISPAWADLAQRAVVRRLSLHDDARVAVIIIPDPAVFEFRPAPPIRLQPARVVAGLASGLKRDTIDLVNEICCEAFGVEPEWSERPLGVPS